MTRRSELKPSDGERATLAVTNLVKLGGLVIALHEALFTVEPRSLVIGIAALMMAGAQSFESFLTSFFGGKK